jgi:hypothetical protein
MMMMMMMMMIIIIIIIIIILIKIELRPAPRKICGGKSGTDGFCPSTLVFL